MIFAWLEKRKQARAQVERDATAMIEQYGGSAYHVARDRALEQRLHKIIDADRTPEHWDQVRFAIRKRLRRKVIDTATKYLRGR
jgi:hypothetical protein